MLSSAPIHEQRAWTEDAQAGLMAPAGRSCAKASKPAQAACIRTNVASAREFVRVAGALTTRACRSNQTWHCATRTCMQRVWQPTTQGCSKAMYAPHRLINPNSQPVYSGQPSASLLSVHRCCQAFHELQRMALSSTQFGGDVTGTNIQRKSFKTAQTPRPPRWHSAAFP